MSRTKLAYWIRALRVRLSRAVTHGLDLLDELRQLLERGNVLLVLGEDQVLFKSTPAGKKKRRVEPGWCRKTGFSARPLASPPT